MNDPSGDLTKRNSTIRPREANTGTVALCRHNKSGKRLIDDFIARKNDLNARTLLWKQVRFAEMFCMFRFVHHAMT
jgi:hypothetical protein